MPQYTPFTISSFETGYFTAREPWKAPKDAFPTLLDARVDRGFLQKRSGLTELADTSAGYPIMGIHAHVRKGHPAYLVADTKRLYEYRPYAETLTDLAGSDTFTGSSRNFFWFQDWHDKCYLCNGVNPPYVYDDQADTLTELDTVSDSDTDVQIDACQMIFVYKSRLLFFGATIDGTWRPRRVYYSEVNTEQVKALNYDDIDAPDIFVSGCYVNDVPTLFGHEGTVARIKYTFSSDTPFSFEPAEQGSGTLGPLRAPLYQRMAIRVGHEGLMSWDGFQSKRMGPQIRDFVAETAGLQNWLMQATMRRDRAILYLAYPNDGSSSNDRILEYNMDEDTFAVHRLSAHTMLGTTGHMVLEPTFFDDGYVTDATDLDVIRHPTYGAFTLMGGHTGKLYMMNSGSDDDGSDIDAEVWSAALNPFVEQGLQCFFGRCRILVGTDATKSCTVSFYKDLSETAYATATLSAAGDGDKHWVELCPNGEAGNFHRMAFTGDLPDIHAIQCDFAPAGRLSS